MSLNFKRKIEDFVCEHCGTSVHGDGYTNHCTNCLWSKHVDNMPGDRAANCGGMMMPIKVEVQRGEYTVIHKCQKCGLERKNKKSIDDNFDSFIEIVKNNL